MIIYNIINCFIDCDYLFNLISFCVPVKTLRFYNLFYIPTCCTNYALNEPVIRALCTLNKINRIVSIDFSMAVKDFKLCLDHKNVMEIFLE